MVVPAKLQYWQSDEQMAGGNYQAALQEYSQIAEKYPKAFLVDRQIECPKMEKRQWMPWSRE